MIYLHFEGTYQHQQSLV